MKIGNFLVKRVMVDNGASVDIMFHDTFMRMGTMTPNKPLQNASIYMFNGVECKVEGAINFPMTIGKEPREATQMLNFQVVKVVSTYNAILGRTRIHAFKVVPSTYHIVLKFPTGNAAGEEREDQKMAQSFYMDALRPNRTMGSPTLEHPSKAPEGPIDKVLVRNNDVFAWIVADMFVIDPNLITHIDPTRKAMQQKKRTYAPDRL
ncbi:uncharacterized protein LOC141674294 [Apium graveolens]|uniref:uncharacterized protein LOC141674294 n=1 Tax=Apium graveolens TaxID=4045 RepID=UPI003D7B79F6